MWKYSFVMSLYYLYAADLMIGSEIDVLPGGIR